MTFRALDDGDVTSPSFCRVAPEGRAHTKRVLLFKRNILVTALEKNAEMKPLLMTENVEWHWEVIPWGQRRTPREHRLEQQGYSIIVCPSKQNKKTQLAIATLTKRYEGGPLQTFLNSGTRFEKVAVYASEKTESLNKEFFGLV